MQVSICGSQIQPLVDPELMGCRGGAPTGVQEQSPWSGGHFLISDTNFFKKLSQKFGKFRVYEERVSLSAPKYKGGLEGRGTKPSEADDIFLFQ